MEFIRVLWTITLCFNGICYSCILLVYPIRIYTKCKKTSNLIKSISSHYICSEIKCEEAKKSICQSVTKTSDFFSELLCSNSQSHIFDSISCVLLKDKPNKSYQNSKKLERNAIFTAEKAFKKKRKQYCTSNDKCPYFTNFFGTPKTDQRKIYTL